MVDAKNHSLRLGISKAFPATDRGSEALSVALLGGAVRLGNQQKRIRARRFEACCRIRARAGSRLVVIEAWRTQSVGVRSYFLLAS